LCIGGRGPLDEAAALLLVSLLERDNVTARLATAREASEPTPHEHDGETIRAVCVCYLNPANTARAPFLMRRIKRRISGAVPIAAFLCAESASPPAEDGYRVVTSLDGAVQAIAAVLATETAPAMTRPVQRAAMSREAPATINPKPVTADWS
jgi:hypothetical protein